MLRVRQRTRVRRFILEFFETVDRRFSCRNYADRPVEEEKLLRCLEAARRAPSSRNGQPTRYVVVNGGEAAEGLIKHTKIEGFNQFADQCQTFVVLYGAQAPYDPSTGKAPPPPRLLADRPRHRGRPLRAGRHGAGPCHLHHGLFRGGTAPEAARYPGGQKYLAHPRGRLPKCQTETTRPPQTDGGTGKVYSLT